MRMPAHINKLIVMLQKHQLSLVAVVSVLPPQSPRLDAVLPPLSALLPRHSFPARGGVVLARSRRPLAFFVLRARPLPRAACAVVSLGLVMLSLRSLNHLICDVHRRTAPLLVLPRQQYARRGGPMSLFVTGSVFGRQVACSNIRYLMCRQGC